MLFDITKLFLDFYTCYVHTIMYLVHTQPVRLLRTNNYWIEPGQILDAKIDKFKKDRSIWQQIHANIFLLCQSNMTTCRSFHRRQFCKVIQKIKATVELPFGFRVCFSFREPGLFDSWDRHYIENIRLISKRDLNQNKIS